jgi:hypothetical protein
MDDAAHVRRGKPPRNAEGDRDDLVERQRAGLETLTKTRSLEVRGGVFLAALLGTGEDQARPT